MAPKRFTCIIFHLFFLLLIRLYIRVGSKVCTCMCMYDNCTSDDSFFVKISALLAIVAGQTSILHKFLQVTSCWSLLELILHKTRLHKALISSYIKLKTQLYHKPVWDCDQVATNVCVCAQIHKLEVQQLPKAIPDIRFSPFYQRAVDFISLDHLWTCKG